MSGVANIAVGRTTFDIELTKVNGTSLHFSQGCESDRDKCREMRLLCRAKARRLRLAPKSEKGTRNKKDFRLERWV